MATDGEEMVDSEKTFDSELALLEQMPRVAKIVNSYVKEKERRKRDNKKYRKNQAIKRNATIAQRCKRMPNDSIQSDNSYVQFLNDEILRILQCNIIDRVHESKKNFRWVTPCVNDTKKILQFQVGNGYFIDLLYVALSKIPNAGYGLFAARDLPKGVSFSIYLGRSVKVSGKKREYTMQLKKTYNNSRGWGRLKKNQPCIVIDALTSDEYSKWEGDRELFLGAHLMNDPKYVVQPVDLVTDRGVKVKVFINDPKIVVQTMLNLVTDTEVKVKIFINDDPRANANCIVQPMLEVVTGRDIKMNEELYIAYNRN